MSFLHHLPFGLIGLGLAVLDFTGASKKLEAVLARYIEVEKRDAATARAALTTMDFAHHSQRFLWFLPGAIVSVLFMFAVWLGLGDANKLLWLQDWLPHWPWWSVLIWGPILLIGWYVLDHLMTRGFSYLVSVMIWRLFWLLSFPKAGIIGSLGLIVAIADNLFG